MMSTDGFEPYPFENGLDQDTFCEFLVWCAQQQVSDIHLQGDNHFVVGLHGRLHRASVFRVADDQMARMIDRVFTPEIRSQVMSGTPRDKALQLDGNETNRWRLGRGERIRFRVNLKQGTAGRQDKTIAWTLRVIPSVIPPLLEMNIEPELLEVIIPAKGLAVWGGIMGSGKSTAVAASLRYCQKKFPHRKVSTIEDPVEYILGDPDNILIPIQSEVGVDVASFAEGIRADLRRAVSVIGVGEMRDRETIDAGIRAGDLGATCITTTHIDSPGDIFPRLINEYPYESRDAMARALLSVLQYVVVQTLLRTTDGRRTAVREYIIIDGDLREKLHGMPWPEWSSHINAIIRSEKSRIIDKAWALYQDKRVDADELLVVMSPGQRRKFETGAL